MRIRLGEFTDEPRFRGSFREGEAGAEPKRDGGSRWGGEAPAEPHGLRRLGGSLALPRDLPAKPVLKSPPSYGSRAVVKSANAGTPSKGSATGSTKLLS